MVNVVHTIYSELFDLPLYYLHLSLTSLLLLPSPFYCCPPPLWFHLWNYYNLNYWAIHLFIFNFPFIATLLHSSPLSLSHCTPLLTPFSPPSVLFCLCVLNQHFRAVCRRPAERPTMELIILPLILYLSPIPHLYCFIPSLFLPPSPFPSFSLSFTCLEVTKLCS